MTSSCAGWYDSTGRFPFQMSGPGKLFGKNAAATGARRPQKLTFRSGADWNSARVRRRARSRSLSGVLPGIPYARCTAMGMKGESRSRAGHCSSDRPVRQAWSKESPAASDALNSWIGEDQFPVLGPGTLSRWRKCRQAAS